MERVALMTTELRESGLCGDEGDAQAWRPTGWYVTRGPAREQRCSCLLHSQRYMCSCQSPVIRTRKDCISKYTRRDICFLQAVENVQHVSTPSWTPDSKAGLYLNCTTMTIDTQS